MPLLPRRRPSRSSCSPERRIPLSTEVIWPFALASELHQPLQSGRLEYPEQAFHIHIAVAAVFVLISPNMSGVATKQQSLKIFEKLKSKPANKVYMSKQLLRDATLG